MAAVSYNCRYVSLFKMTMRNTFLALLGTAAVLLAVEPYAETYRPQFHFSPKVNWTNDPCGLVFFGGKYHMFFQYNPFGDLWGHMSWGHAETADLTKWTELPVAIPEGPDAMIFTGSSVVDTNNSSGLCQPGTQCIVSIYTGHTKQKQTQNLAYSQDGRTWKKYSGNPVLDLEMTDFRDPKVFWHAASKQWIMVAVLAKEKKARLFASPNLKNWKQLSDFGPAGAVGGVWECPDLFELPIEGDSTQKRWVLKIGLNPGHVAGGSGEQYFVGQFDGTRFQNEGSSKEPVWLDYGRDCYCALTWNNEPDQKKHMIAWMNNWDYARDAPTNPWRGAMTLPRSLALRRSPEGIRLAQSPAAQVQALRAEAFTYQGKDVADVNRKIAAWPHRSQTFEMLATVKPGSAQRIAWKILEGGGDYTLVGYDVNVKQLFVDRTKSGNTAFNAKFPSRTVAPLHIGTEPLELHIFVDRSSVEVFSGHGETVLTNLVFPKPDSTGIAIETGGGSVDSIGVSIWKLRSTWK
jgi:fructan beta-fructosidase